MASMRIPIRRTSASAARSGKAGDVRISLRFSEMATKISPARAAAAPPSTENTGIQVAAMPESMSTQCDRTHRLYAVMAWL